MNNIIREFKKEVGNQGLKQLYLEVECNECSGTYVTAKNDHKRVKYPFTCRKCVSSIKGARTLRDKNGVIIEKNADRDRLLVIWNGMKSRCYNEGHRMYHRYGARGIKVEFQDFGNFYLWAINNGYKKELTIDRIDGDDNYKAENCRWATRLEQAQCRVSGKTNKSGLQGVRKNTSGTFTARHMYKGKESSLGVFNTAEEAYAKYLEHRGKPL